ncbi:MAG: hypothetical protein IKI11_04865 [Neisseriaceae bacterium]|nr:hypothetical protein [Neisseriaceae bacterium]
MGFPAHQANRKVCIKQNNGRVGLRPTVTNETISGSLKDYFNGMIFLVA